jgi:phytoene desaturase
MRTVKGKTDRVVVVGGGLSGLSAALYLAGRGRNVTVVEREAHPGGRVGRADVNGYRLDMGPTVLTMPDIIDDAMAAVGEKLTDRLDLQSVHPAYNAIFAGGESLQVHTEPTAMYAEVERFAGRREADAYLRMRQWLTKLYETEFDGFIGANFDSPLSLLTPQLARLLAMGGFRRWESVIRRFLTDERLLRVFTFQALYAGVPPQSALAVYAVIAYMDTVAGVYFPRGGMRALPDAMAAAAADAGVEFIYGATVSTIERSGSRATAVITDTGRRVPADAVVLTTELPDTYRLLDYAPRRLLKLRPAPSAVVAHVGVPAVDDRIGHHTILFGDAWKQTFSDIITDGRVMGDPSLLVTRPTAGDPSLAPPGRDLLYVLAPTPNTEVGRVDWDATSSTYVEHMLGAVRERLPQLGDDMEVLSVVTPADWGRQGMLAGTPFALAHTFAQTGPFRPANTVRGVDNVVLAGSSTVPGVGVPTAVMSGRLAADRITGVPARQANREVVTR